MLLKVVTVYTNCNVNTYSTQGNFKNDNSQGAGFLATPSLPRSMVHLMMSDAITILNLKEEGAHQAKLKPSHV